MERADKSTKEPVSKLRDYLANYGADFAVQGIARGEPVKIEVLLPEDSSNASLNIPCEVCDIFCPLVKQTREFPFDDLGVVLSFEGEQVYKCGDCGLETGLPDTNHRAIIAETLSFVTKRLRLAGVATHPPSVDEVRDILA